MRDLAARLTALDPDAGAALQVIAYFDRLVEGRAGLPAIIRGAAVLAGCPARLTDPRRRISLRVQPDGTNTTPAPSAQADSGRAASDQAAAFGGSAASEGPAWMSVEVTDGAVLRLERIGPPGPVDAMILERAAAAARAVLDRTPAPPTDSLKIVVNPDATEAVRLQAASRLGLTTTDFVRAIARPDGHIHLATDRDPPPGPQQRTGVGPLGPVLTLPESWAAARTALRFTADGTEPDPGPRIVHAEHLGGLALLAAVITPDAVPVPDVRALDRVAATAPWALATLNAAAEAPSLRAAAATLRLHHSTMQERLSHIDHQLGWDFRTPPGRLRLQLAFALRRLHHNPAD
ncbi:helix-turn-helix domain-containing protein [Actinoplanes awajinensis]|uniref:PucR C-terminal helix-turn-helix domain-containing protein n=1 Tax=Actinoplanes awajinensis subsp. mycoplanecinus TaxID=135947 RepID=A0A101JU33_9ACTN|nr:helix-turn-helix domain-containing protein [Actinoplanes awajinensis]KUL33032.1 hypothetical protein ADL15_18635 [Actinoplanes awajinensis subsp. mycoplanecinus]